MKLVSSREERGLEPLAGRRVVMTVWNTFMTDARVTKEAETLIQSGAAVLVLAVRPEDSLPANEVTASGIRVMRVSKRLPFFDAPLRSLRNLWKRKQATTLNPGSARAVEHEEDAAADPRSRSLLLRLASAIGAVTAMLRMAWQAWKENADVYHAHDANTLHILWPVAVLRRKPLIYDAHEISTDREGYGRWHRLVYYMEKFLTPRVAGMITTTDLRADHFVEAYGCRRPVVLQNRPRYAIRPEKGVLRERLGIAHDRFVVLYQGGIQPGRGLRNLVRVAARIPDIDLVMIGGGRQDAEVAALITELGVGGRVHRVPTVPLAELPAWTVDADVGMQVLRNTCLNHWTTDSNKLFEYILAGVPVIASNFPEIRRVVEQGRFGLLIEPDDLDSIETAIRRMKDHRPFHEECRQNCINAREAWSWEAQEHLLRELYEQILY